MNTDTNDLFKDKEETVANNTGNGIKAEDKKQPMGGTEMRQLPLGDLNKPDWHPRAFSDQIDGLTESIKEVGLLDPLRVQETDDGQYYVIDGTRRLEACKELGHEKVSCYVQKGLSDEDAAKESFIINIARESLSPIDKARYMNKLQGKGHTLRGIAAITGYGSAPIIDAYLKLLKLSESVQNRVHSGDITKAQALEILEAPIQDQEDVAKVVIEDGLSAKQTDKYVAKLLDKKGAAQAESQDNIPTDLPGIIKRCQNKMPEQPSESMDLVCTFLPHHDIKTGGTKAEFIDSIDPILQILIDTRDKVRQGASLGIIYEDPFSRSDEGNLRFIGTHIHPVLTNHSYEFKDRVIIEIVDEDKIKEHNQKIAKTPHTNYRLLKSTLVLDRYQKKGDKNSVPKVTEERSRPSEDELKYYTSPIWRVNVQEHGGKIEALKHVANRFISLYSNVGENVLDPFALDPLVIKAALELERVPTAYVPEQHYSPETWADIYDAEDIEPQDGLKKAKAVEEDSQSDTDEASSETDSPFYADNKTMSDAAMTAANPQ